MYVCYECCVLSGRGLCNHLITRPEESYRLWCVVECDLETSWMRRLWPTVGCWTKKENKNTHGRFCPNPFLQITNQMTCVDITTGVQRALYVAQGRPTDVPDTRTTCHRRRHCSAAVRCPVGDGYTGRHITVWISLHFSSLRSEHFNTISVYATYPVSLRCSPSCWLLSRKDRPRAWPAVTC